MSKRKTTDEFIAEAIGKHGNIFSYEKTKYINNVTKIIVGCKIHGDFLISPTSHVNQGSKCPSCC